MFDQNKNLLVRAENVKSKPPWIKGEHETVRIYEDGTVETRDGAITVKDICYDARLKLNQLEEKQNKNSHTSFPDGMKLSWGKTMKVKKLHKNAKLPTKANLSDAGYDLYALDGGILQKHTHALIKTGISMEIPEGYVGLIWPRSGLSYKYGLDVFAGVIDSGYRGDIGVILYNSQYNSYEIEAGDRIAQILFQKVEDFDMVELEELNNSKRSQKGFGSSGK